jgi:cytochrome P450
LRLIDERRREGTDGRGDLLSMLIEARDEQSGAGMDDRQLRDEVMTLFLAGHETTAMSLAWTFVLLSENPTVRAALAAEVDARLGDAASPDARLAVPYVRMVLEEAMRIYPPAWIVTRSVEQDDEIDGFRVAQGSLVLLSPWVTHRDETLWPNPEAFDPRRFAPDAPERPRHAYVPFGGGPHLCIGAPFAMLEAQLVLATVARRYELELVPGQRIAPEPLVTLRPKPRVLVRLRAR